MGLDAAAVNLGADNAISVLLLGCFMGGWGVIMAGLLTGKRQADLSECIKWGTVCLMLTPIFFIGQLLAIIISYKSYSLSKH